MQVLTDSKTLIKAWIDGVELEDAARAQLENLASLPFIHRHIAVMPDVHAGCGSTVGSVIPTDQAIIPAAVGVDIGCGMIAVRTSLNASDLPDNLSGIRSAIEGAVPHGRTANGDPNNDRGAWNDLPTHIADSSQLRRSQRALNGIAEKIDDRKFDRAVKNFHRHAGTLGTGNHFVEVCLDQDERVWIMLHSGSRGIGNAIGRTYIEKAKEEMRRWHINLPDVDLAYLPEGSTHFANYIEAMLWAQDFAAFNRRAMLDSTLKAVRPLLPDFTLTDEAINCHHNYATRENHFGRNVWVTRKGAVAARKDQLGIIPGSMGARSFIVRGKGNQESFCSCSHGAGRRMSRTQARKQFTIEDHVLATQGVECRKDADVIDETPAAYKDIDAVMAAQTDLVDVVHTLRQVVCVKG